MQHNPESAHPSPHPLGSANDCEQTERQAEHHVGQASAVTLTYSILTEAISGLALFGVIRFTHALGGNNNLQSIVLSLLTVIADIFAAIIVIAVFSRTQLGKRTGYFCGVRLRSRHAMTLKDCVLCLLVTTGVGKIGTFIGGAVQALFNALGWSGTSTNDTATSLGTGSVVGMVSFGIIAPIIEETVFRGCAMPMLERYGKPFAIVTTAVLFGCMHQDLVQGIGAGLSGLAYGWVASEYSITWSMAMHIFNNSILSLGIPMLMELFRGDDQLVALGVNAIAIFAIIAVMIAMFIAKRASIRTYFAQNANIPHVFKSWRSPLFLVTIALSVAVALLSVIRP